MIIKLHHVVDTIQELGLEIRTCQGCKYVNFGSAGQYIFMSEKRDPSWYISVGWRGKKLNHTNFPDTSYLKSYIEKEIMLEEMKNL